MEEIQIEQKSAAQELQIDQEIQKQIKDSGNLKDLKKEVVQEGDVNLIIQGRAKIYTQFRSINKQGKTIEQEVFYNPVQIFNRDLTILTIRNFANQIVQPKRNEQFDGLTILDALSASGLRAIRYSQEIDCIQSVYANDISEASIKLMKDNFDLNQLDYAQLNVTHEDALSLLYESRKQMNINDYSMRFDVIDLDPYGSVMPFLDAAIQACSSDTLLCITCTDSRVLCGPDTQKCFYQYGSARAKVKAFQENSLRVLLYSINSAANRYCKFMKPLLSYQSEFYLRVFVVISFGKSQSAESFNQVGNIFNCDHCGNYHVHRFGHGKILESQYLKFVPSKLEIPSGVCQQCGNNFTINGPIWLDQLNDVEFVSQMIEDLNSDQFDLDLKTKQKINGTLYAMQREAPFRENPLGYCFTSISSLLKVSAIPKLQLQSAFESLKFGITQSYTNPSIFQTNANNDAVYDIMRSWKIECEKGPDNKFRGLDKDQHAQNIMEKQIKNHPNFNLEVKQQEQISIYLHNPEQNWGPKQRAVAYQVLEDEENQTGQQIQKEKDEEFGDIIKKQLKKD